MRHLCTASTQNNIVFQVEDWHTWLSTVHYSSPAFPPFRLNVWFFFFLPLMYSWQFTAKEKKESGTQTRVCIDNAKVEYMKFNPNPNLEVMERASSEVAGIYQFVKHLIPQRLWDGLFAFIFHSHWVLEAKFQDLWFYWRSGCVLNPLSTQNKCKDSPRSQRSTSVLFKSSMSCTATPKKKKNTKIVLLHIPEIVTLVSHISPERTFELMNSCHSVWSQKTFRPNNFSVCVCFLIDLCIIDSPATNTPEPAEVARCINISLIIT